MEEVRKEGRKGNERVLSEFDKGREAATETETETDTETDTETNEYATGCRLQATLTLLTLRPPTPTHLPRSDCSASEERRERERTL